jgi:EmrB/QacA subfamily drug resistance transporter
MEQAQPRSNARWTFLITAVALLMVVLDNLVVSTALPTIQRDLNATLEGLEWTVNAYTLTFAVLLLPAAALGDRFGRRRMFVFGLTLFTLASAGAALSNSIETLILARAIQGTGAAFVVPLTLTLLSAAVPADRRGVALGAWGAIGGLAVALGPLVGGAIVEGISWHWIFWLNVPIGLVLIPFGYLRLTESRGPADKLDLPGVVLVAVGLLAVVWAVIKGNELGWASAPIVISFTAGVLMLAAFLWWERRAAAPMLPLYFFKSRAFSMANVASLLMYFGMFGAIFLLSQYLQIVLGNSPFQAGLRILPWTLAPIFIAPIAGASSDRIGGGLLMGVGLAMQAIGLAWLGLVVTPTVDYAQLVIPFIISGIGMGLFFAPVANVVLSAVRPKEEGQASGANNAIREVGGVFGVAILASVFSSFGGYGTPQTFVDGLKPAILIGAVFVALGSVAAFAIPKQVRMAHPELDVEDGIAIEGEPEGTSVLAS